MQRRLPSLTSLRAFEAAGRHLSFTKAAAELTVTQAAISHQVKALEQQLNVALFVRLPRQLKLTAAGESLLPVVHQAFDTIAAGVAELKGTQGRAALTVRLAPSFSAKWLSPRLGAFRRLYPHIELSLTHAIGPADFKMQSIDLAVTYGKGDWPGVVAAPVLSLDFIPVCSPNYLQGEYVLRAPADLAHCTLLHDGTYENWSAWLDLADVSDVDAKRGPVLDDTNVLIRAAVDGLGIALGSSIFVEDHLRAGRLVQPFKPVLRDEHAYYVVCPPAHCERPEVAAFRDWLIEQSESAADR
jgi:LysR family glycine cleavage system transcriptional activator